MDRQRHGGPARAAKFTNHHGHFRILQLRLLHEEAKSDGANMLALDQLEGLLQKLLRIRQAIV